MGGGGGDIAYVKRVHSFVNGVGASGVCVWGGGDIAYVKRVHSFVNGVGGVGCVCVWGGYCLRKTSSQLCKRGGGWGSGGGVT